MGIGVSPARQQKWERNKTLGKNRAEFLHVTKKATHVRPPFRRIRWKVIASAVFGHREIVKFYETQPQKGARGEVIVGGKQRRGE